MKVVEMEGTTLLQGRIPTAWHRRIKGILGQQGQAIQQFVLAASRLYLIAEHTDNLDEIVANWLTEVSDEERAQVTAVLAKERRLRRQESKKQA